MQPSGKVMIIAVSALILYYMMTTHNITQQAVKGNFVMTATSTDIMRVHALYSRFSK